MNGPPDKDWAALAGTALENQADCQASEITDTQLGNFHQLGYAISDVIAGVSLPLSEVDEVYLDTPPAVLNEAVWAHLYDLGVTGRGVNGHGSYGALGIDSVNFLPGERFDFCRLVGFTGAVTAIVVPIFDEDGTLVDLGAWSQQHNRFALWRGAAPALGLENIFAPRIDGPLVAHPNVLSWLRAERRGVLIVDAKAAATRLAGVTLRVEDPAFGRQIIEKLSITPRVVISRKLAA